MTGSTSLTNPKRLRAALKDGKPPIKFERYAFMSQAGELRKVTWSEPMALLAELWTFGNLLSREDYDLDNESHPGQRGVYEDQVKKIAEGIRTSTRPYLGTLVVGMEQDSEFVDIEEIEELMSGVFLVRIAVREGAPVIWSVDGQHREIALDRVWALVKDADEGDELVVRRYIEQSAVEMTMLLEGDPDILSTLFVKMASTKPIDPSLIAVMDKENATNRLGQYVIKNARLCQGRTSYLPDTAHKRRDSTFASLYKAAGVRSAASAIAGVGVRDRSPKLRETHLNAIIRKRTTETGISGDAVLTAIGAEIVEALDYAYECIPGWREISTGALTVPEFRRRYLHSAAAGLHVIANTIAAARIVGVPWRKVVDALAELPWQRDALRTTPANEEDGTPETAAHVFFEGTLAKTVWDERALCWRASASGATRAGYESAISRVLRHIATEYAELKEIASDATFTELGLIARKSGPGRPKKTAA
ncbi:DNA sulfur modification protein DndB [Streptomyces sp. NPDC059717]|uniref:DNA sulfur modification protein DndB n=1 Tax=Streptomyces sp. NPDC059717 TaxID=3346922 RepID=UPI003691272F